METPPFEEEKKDSAESEPSAKQEKMNVADRAIAEELKEIFARADEEARGRKTFTLNEREYPIENEYDRRLSREQLITKYLEALLEEARSQESYYREKELAKLVEFSHLKEDITARSAEIARHYPETVAALIARGEIKQ